MIEERHHPELDLMVYTASASLDPDDVRAVGDALYAMDRPPRRVLWDMAAVERVGFTADSMQRVQRDLRRKVHGRDGGRTAVVAPGDLVFGLARQYFTLASSDGFPVEQQVFRTLDQACAWLGIDPSALEEAA